MNEFNREYVKFSFVNGFSRPLDMSKTPSLSLMYVAFLTKVSNLYEALYSGTFFKREIPYFL